VRLFLEKVNEDAASCHLRATFRRQLTEKP